MLINSDTPHITKNNSTIFKNIDLTKIISQYSQLNKAVERYNNVQTKAQSFQNAHNSTLQKSQSNIGRYLASLNGANASFVGYIKYLVSAKASTIALEVATNAMNLALKTGIVVGVSLLVSQISKLAHVQEEARKKSIELTNAYKEQQSSLDEQIEKYKELKEELDSGNLSVDESRSIKEQLLEIQKSLIESYGDEVSNIDLVNGKYREQLGLLSALSKEKASTYVKENRSAYEDARKELEKTRSYKIGSIFSYESREGMSDEQKQLYEYIKSYSDLFEIRNMYDTSSFGNSDYAPTLFVNANADDAKVIIDQFYDDIKKYIEENNLQLDYDSLQVDLSKISSSIKTDEELKEYRDIYDEFMKAEIVRNDTLRPLYQESIQAVEDYNKALSTGEGVEEAKANLESVQQSVQSATGELEGSQGVFDGIYEGINKDAEAAYELDQAFKNDDTVQGYAEQLRGLEKVDLQNIRLDNNNLEKGEQTFSELLKVLGYADPTQEQIQSLIDKLIELGYVVGEVTDTTTVINFDSVSFLESVSAIQSGYEQLLSAQEEYNEYGAITASTLKDLMDNNLIQYLQYTADGLSINTKALEDNEQALKDQAIAELYSAMCNDIQNLSLEDTNKLSTIAQSAIANLDSVATTAGENAAIAAQGWWEYSASIQSIPGVSDLTGDNYKKAQAIVNQYKNLASSINSLSIGNTNSTKKKTSSDLKDAENAIKDYVKSYMSYMKASLDASKIDYKTYSREVSSFLKRMFDEGKISGEEYFNYVKEQLEEEKAILDSVIDAVTTRIDLEIDAIKAEQDSIQDMIDKLREENDENERGIKLQKARYELARLQTQRTQKFYTGSRGYIYTVDNDKLREAQGELSDLKFEEIVNGLEREKDALNDSIEELESYKDKWHNIKNEHERTQKNMYANSVLGAGWESDVLNGRIDVLNNFADRYFKIQQDIADAAWKSANEQIKAAQEAQRQTGITVNTTSKPVLREDIVTQNEQAKSAAKVQLEKDIEDTKANLAKAKADMGKAPDNASRALIQKRINLYESVLADLNAKYAKYHTGLEKGIIKKNNSTDDFSILKKAGLNQDEVPIIAREGEVVLTPVQMGNIADRLRLLDNVNIQPMLNIPNYSHLNNVVARNNMQPTIVSIGDIRMEGVQNVDSFARELQKRLPSISVQFRNKH